MASKAKGRERKRRIACAQHTYPSIIPAPAAIAKNCPPIDLASFHLCGPVSSNSGTTPTVPTYRNVPAVKGKSKSPQFRLVPTSPALPAPFTTPPAVAPLPPNSCTVMPIIVPNTAPRAVTNCNPIATFLLMPPWIRRAKSPDFVRDFVAEDCQSGRGADGGGGVEGAAEGEAVGDVVREIGDYVEVGGELDLFGFFFCWGWRGGERLLDVGGGFAAAEGGGFGRGGGAGCCCIRVGGGGDVPV